MGTTKTETMKTFAPAGEFTPTDLVAPDGRKFTAGSLPEYNELVAQGYSVAPATDAPEQTDEATTQPDFAPLTSAAPPVTDEAKALAADPDAVSADATPAEPVADATPATGKASARRDGGAK
ncbi:hypothetical protein CH276_28050 [Rhodococcus sp. 06-470-2]|uniref:hypothetical protein n=1 Tax=unclassified Rhodococcus (in: high G+C Gram-positive bacteria) TaxID=192944 RepID=UPI000B9B4BD8|nr:MULTISPECIES: hypothetical protein [unclassified Rhodococcus (in: high G+C Gram-positive bacteria)]OZC55962.1 hypothetical protein CH276_28050 [Rhodococcus sp. 06-470-2]OZE64842.1 hypothetical protein CH265_10370 [Rhodococcus sp. 05-2221-1B]